MERCLRCGRNKVVSPSQRLCLDCLMKVFPRIRFEEAVEGFGIPRKLLLVEDDGDVKVYEPMEKVLDRKRP